MRSEDSSLSVLGVKRGLLVGLFLCALLIVPAAQATTPLTKAKRAIRSEVRAYFATGSIYSRCTRVSATRYTCRWHSTLRHYSNTDYYGSARVTVGRYGGTARLYHVRCHYCEDGPVPWRLR